ncbi:hypothetical protein BD626DRAFT_493965 [Schizophyllum amplum]|uniref:NAD(P)-binding protein n=1 Tax=Schizophyllum amplum TaxID=97359 RepID=A0A550CH90_9AGAR|nr:hypothetical protein BD626DRAFT_493965 [Auriculariopsis ampla]
MSYLADLFSVEGRVVLITGGGSGLGYHMAEGFIKSGAKVYITGRRENVLKQSTEKLNSIGPGTAAYCAADVSSPESIKKLVAFVESRETVLDVLINNSGIGGGDPSVSHLDSIERIQEVFTNSDPTNWDKIYRTNIWAPFAITIAFLHLLGAAAKARPGEGRGSVIMISSTNANSWNPYMSLLAYNSSKAALNLVTKTLAAKVYTHGVRVNTLSPGPFPTDMNDPTQEEGMTNPSNFHRLPMGRAGNADEISGAALYFASKASAFTHGADLLVDGGLGLVQNGTNRITP